MAHTTAPTRPAPGGGAHPVYPIVDASKTETATRTRARGSEPQPAPVPGMFQLRATIAALPRLGSFLRGARTVLVLNHPEITVAEDIAATLQGDAGAAAYTRYEVQVNRTLKSAVHVERFRTGHLPARLAVLAYWIATLAFAPREHDHSPALWHRARRFLSRRARSVVQAARRMVWGDATDTSAALSKHVLTEKLHLVPDFRFPAGLHVALTKNCNLQCIMCPYHSEELRAQHAVPYFKEGERMPEALLERILAEAGRHRANIAFGQYDEPFIYKGFAKWAARARQAGCTVAITTNGTLLDKEDARTLLEARVENISFSLDAASEETYRKIRLDDFKLPIENLRRLVRMRDAGGYPTQIRACMVLQEHNQHEVEAFSALMEEIGVDIVSYYNLTVLDQGVWRIPTLNFDVEDDQPGERNVCSQLYNQLAVYPDGKVALCCLTTMYVGYRTDVPYVGNAKTQALRDIWLSEPYLQVRREAFEKTFSNSVCRDCTIWHNFQGRDFVDAKGRRVHKNAYETFVYLH